MVVALENVHGQVGKCVVTLLVVYPKQRCYLRKTFGHVGKQGVGRLYIVWHFKMKLHQHHPFARVAIAYHDIAQQSCLLSKVEESDVMC